MAKQERSARTREALVGAAAAVFDAEGYAATLARVASAAGLSLGALTFHFPAKDDLADAVQAAGSAAVRGALDRLPPHLGGLASCIRLTVEVVRLLESDVTVRAAARLSRERGGAAAGWDAAWRSALERLLDRAFGAELRPAAHPRLVLALADCLVAGAEARIRAAGGADARRCEHGCAGWVAEIWRLVLPALAVDVSALLGEAAALWDG